MNQRPIFQSVSQAIHFAFLMLEFESSPETIMSKLIRKRLQELGEWDEVRPEDKTVNFGNLSPLEIRGQAAMIRLSVEALLPGPESWALKARYGQTKVTRGKEGEKRVSFPEDRIRAIKALCAYLSPQFDSIGSEALSYLVARAVAECDELRPSFRDIAEHTGANHETLRRKFKDIRHKVLELQNMGMDRLEPVFRADGLIPDFAEV